MQKRQRPAIDFRTFLYRHRFGQVNLVEPCVEHEETVRVPEGIDKGTGNVGNDID
jgi:hypothetical protein